MLAINTKTTIMKLSSKEPEQYSLILHIRHHEHQKTYSTDMLFLSHSLTYILDQTEEEGRRICIQNIIERNINQENQDENETI